MLRQQNAVGWEEQLKVHAVHAETLQSSSNLILSEVSAMLSSHALHAETPQCSQMGCCMVLFQAR